MPAFVINVRRTPDGRLPRAVRLARHNRQEALAALGKLALLFSPRDEAIHGYFGVARIADLDLDLSDTNFMLVTLDTVQLFPTVVPVSRDGHPFEGEAAADKTTRYRFYSRGIRPLAETAADEILREGGSASFDPAAGLYRPQGLAETMQQRFFQPSERLVRDAELRMEILLLHGPVCAMTGDNWMSPDGSAAELDICHIKALRYGGPGILQNVLPLSKRVHWAFDEGLVSMEDDGTIILAGGVSQQIREAFGRRRRANFPRPVELWPYPELINFHRENVFRGK